MGSPDYFIFRLPASCMEKTVKINENYIFRRLYRRGKSQVSPCLVVYHHRVKARKYNRLGITATKKIGGAVERNRARRVILEAYRLLEPQMRGGYDYVIVARAKAVSVKMQAVKRELEDALSKMGGINPPTISDAESGRQKDKQ